MKNRAVVPFRQNGPRPIPARDATRRTARGNAVAGRGQSSRISFAETFSLDMFEAWQANGREVIADVIANDPVAFLRICMALLPKEFGVKIEQQEHRSSAEIEAEIVALLEDAGLRVSRKDPG